MAMEIFLYQLHILQLGIHSSRERQTPFQGDGVSSDDKDRRVRKRHDI